MLRYLKDKYYEWSTRGNEGVFTAPKNLKPLLDSEKSIVDAFHNLYYKSWQEGRKTIDISWMGYRTLKCPLDLWIYQEILFEHQPDIIIETGTFLGGSAFYLAHLCGLIGKGRVISVDLQQRSNLPEHPLIEYITGSSTDPKIIAQLKEKTNGKSVMVILDSDHKKSHVLNELNLYKELVSVTQYLIVEDSNINGNPTNPEHGPGPMEAIFEFLPKNPNFIIDKDRERFLMTLNPNGYLQKISMQ